MFTAAISFSDLPLWAMSEEADNGRCLNVPIDVCLKYSLKALLHLLIDIILGSSSAYYFSMNPRTISWLSCSHTCIIDPSFVDHDLHSNLNIITLVMEVKFMGWCFSKNCHFGSLPDVLWVKLKSTHLIYVSNLRIFLWGNVVKYSCVSSAVAISFFSLFLTAQFVGAKGGSFFKPPIAYSRLEKI